MEKLQAYEVGDGMPLPFFNVYRSEISISDAIIAGIRALTDHMEAFVKSYRESLDDHIELEFYTWPGTINVSSSTLDPNKTGGVMIVDITCVFGGRDPLNRFMPTYRRHGLSIKYYTYLNAKNDKA